MRWSTPDWKRQLTSVQWPKLVAGISGLLENFTHSSLTLLTWRQGYCKLSLGTSNPVIQTTEDSEYNKNHHQQHFIPVQEVSALATDQQMYWLYDIPLMDPPLLVWFYHICESLSLDPSLPAHSSQTFNYLKAYVGDPCTTKQHCRTLPRNK